MLRAYSELGDAIGATALVAYLHAQRQGKCLHGMRIVHWISNKVAIFVESNADDVHIS